jgi:hypothetical protein
MDSTVLAPDVGQWQAIVKAGMNLMIQCNKAESVFVSHRLCCTGLESQSFDQYKVLFYAKWMNIICAIVAVILNIPQRKKAVQSSKEI